jgi:hypothetical protein
MNMSSEWRLQWGLIFGWRVMACQLLAPLWPFCPKLTKPLAENAGALNTRMHKQNHGKRAFQLWRAKGNILPDEEKGQS